MPCIHLRNCWNSTHPGLKNGKVLSSQEFLELSPSQSLAREDCSEKSSLGFSAHTGPPGEMFLSAQPSKYSEAMATRVQEAWAGGRHGITHRILVLQRCRPMRAPGSWRQNARPISKEKLIQALCSKARIPAGRQLVQDARDIDSLLGKVLGGQQSQPTQQTMWATTRVARLIPTPSHTYTTYTWCQKWSYKIWCISLWSSVLLWTIPLLNWYSLQRGGKIYLVTLYVGSVELAF